MEKQVKKQKKTAIAVILAICLMSSLFVTAFTQVQRVENNRKRAAVPIPAQSLFELCADAVFFIETFDIEGEEIRTGSGFFISDTGLAVTILHVLDDAASARITTKNGDEYAVLGVAASSWEFNLALLLIDAEDISFSYLELGDSDLLQTGNTIYTIGNPLGYTSTMTAGIIGKTERLVDGQTLIQFTAPISFGSGGSPLINSVGLVIGLASSSFSYGQNLNLAVPVNRVKELEPGDCVPLESLLQVEESNVDN